MNANEKNFCTSPFSEIRINSDGTYNFCHGARAIDLEQSESIYKQDLDYYFNKSTSVLNVRKKLLNGESSNRCTECLKTEKIFPYHLRIRRNLNFNIFPDKDFDQSFKESPIQRIIEDEDKRPYFYHVSLSNLCNLGCVMCCARDSSYMGNLLKQTGDLPKDAKILTDWTTDKQVWNKFLDHILSNKLIQSFHFMGGEPLYHKKFYEFIDFCVYNNHTNFHISFVTNATIVPDAGYINKLKKFKSVQIEVSVENFDLSNDYVRHPSVYSTIEQNIKKYLSYCDQRFTLVVRTVPQFLTLFNYDKLLQWCLDNKICIESNIIYSPRFLIPALLPNNLKDQIISKLSKFVVNKIYDTKNINIRDTVRYKDNISENAKMIINHLKQTTTDSNSLNKQAVEYFAKLDRARKINIKNYIPEIVPLFEQYNYDKLIS